jgi:hypothetical protein
MNLFVVALYDKLFWAKLENNFPRHGLFSVNLRIFFFKKKKIMGISWGFMSCDRYWQRLLNWWNLLWRNIDEYGHKYWCNIFGQITTQNGEYICIKIIKF